jgi:Animal haem peroxidase
MKRVAKAAVCTASAMMIGWLGAAPALADDTSDGDSKSNTTSDGDNKPGTTTGDSTVNKPSTTVDSTPNKPSTTGDSSSSTKPTSRVEAQQNIQTSDGPAAVSTPDSSPTSAPKPTAKPTASAPSPTTSVASPTVATAPDPTNVLGTVRVTAAPAPVKHDSEPTATQTKTAKPTTAAVQPSQRSQPSVAVPEPATNPQPAPVANPPDRAVDIAAVVATAAAQAERSAAPAVTARVVSEPAEPPKAVSALAATVLTSVGLNPFSSATPGAPAPADSPALLALMEFARRQEGEQSSFGRMFPGLEPLNQQTNQELADLAQTMREGAAVANPNGTTAGVTFFGQFIDHDLTLDTLPQPDSSVDPTTLKNGRTFAFDLDSVYGGGPKVSPQLYDGKKFKIGVATDGVSPDLPRNPDGKDGTPDDGTAILIEPRNDENLIIAQIHLSFLRLHNALIDQGMSFDQAQKTVIDAYRYVVINDYLPQIVGQDAVDAALKTPIKKGFYDPGSKDAPMTPIEFSVAAFRFGHSQVRNAYNINDTSGGIPVFSLDPKVDDLRGGRQLPAKFIIDFDNFFSELPQDGGPLLIGRAIDTDISASLFALPIPGAEATGDNVLAFRNMLRAKFYDMPSGEEVAAAMGVPVVGEPVFEQGTPLWYYILREAEMTCKGQPCKPGEVGGGELGPVGGRIVAETFADVMRLSGPVRKPMLPDISGGDFRIGDLLVAADQLTPTKPDSACEVNAMASPGYHHRPGRSLQRHALGTPLSLWSGNGNHLRERPQ